MNTYTITLKNPIFGNIHLHTMEEEYDYYKENKQQICDELVRVNQYKPETFSPILNDIFADLNITALPHVLGLLKYNGININFEVSDKPPSVTPKHLLLAQRGNFKVWQGLNRITLTDDNNIIARRKTSGFIIGYYSQSITKKYIFPNTGQEYVWDTTSVYTWNNSSGTSDTATTTDYIIQSDKNKLIVPSGGTVDLGESVVTLLLTNYMKMNYAYYKKIEFKNMSDLIEYYEKVYVWH